MVLPGLVLSLFYGTCNAALGVYWEYASVWRETGLMLISVALGFCASSFSRELGGRTAHRVWAALAVVSLPAVAVFVMVFLVTPLEWVHNPPHYWPATMRGLASSLFWILLWDVVTPAVALVIGGVISIRAFSTGSPGLRKPKLA